MDNLQKEEGPEETALALEFPRIDPAGPDGVACEEGLIMAEAYCVKCRSRREIKDPKSVTLKNGRPAIQGVCPVCGKRPSDREGLASPTFPKLKGARPLDIADSGGKG